MTYATRQDLVARFGSAAVAQLAADPDEASVDRTAAALADASAVADAHVGVRYKLPLPSGDWPLLRDAVCDIARLELYADRPVDEVAAAAKRARARLMEIAKGKLRLVDGAGDEPPRLVRVTARSGEPRMQTLGSVWP